MRFMLTHLEQGKAFRHFLQALFRLYGGPALARTMLDPASNLQQDHCIALDHVVISITQLLADSCEHSSIPTTLDSSTRDHQSLTDPRGALSRCVHELDGKRSDAASFTSSNIASSLTCRQRKLKCDEKKPVCGQCIKASRECIPSSGIVFRHQHNASMNGDDSGDENSLKGFYSYKNTFEEDAIWLDIPKNGRFLPM